MTWVIWVKGVKQGSGGDFQSVELISLKSQFHLWTSKRIWHDHNSSRASLESTLVFSKKFDRHTQHTSMQSDHTGWPFKNQNRTCVLQSLGLEPKNSKGHWHHHHWLSQHPALPLSWNESSSSTDWWSIESKNVGAFETFLGQFNSSAKVVFNAAFSAEMWH